jgi:flagellar biosynthetic protein FlhB
MSDVEHNGTEAPTPRRREQAREEGQVVLSTDLTASVALLTGCAILLWTGSTLGARLMNGFREWMTDVPGTEWNAWNVTLGARWMSSELVGICGLFVLAILSVGLAFGFAQVGFVISFKSLELKWERLIPENPLSKLISMDSGIKGVLNAMKVTLLLGISMLMLWLRRGELSIRNFGSIDAVAACGWRLGLIICLAMSGVAVALALTDYLIKWFRQEQKLKMTREEIKQEQKDDNGDPHVKAAVRRKQREARKQQSVKDVPKANLILTNPTHLAIAIQYQPGKMRAPKIVAKGAGVFAQNIVRIAKENKIPVMERKPLARALYKIVGQEIPFEFFRAIAEILAQIYKAKNGTGTRV